MEHLLVVDKMKKIVQTIQLRLDVNLDKKVKDHLLRERVITHLLVVEMHLLVTMVVEMHLLLETRVVE